LLEVIGLLLLGIAVIGFFFILVRIGPTFVDSIRYFYQQSAKFFFGISLVYLLIFPFIGLAGIALAGIGLALGYVGTETALSTSVNSLDQVHMRQHKEPPTNHAG